MHRGRDFFLTWALRALVLSGIAPTVGLAAETSLYAAVVPNSNAQQAAQDGMREVLVRLIGARDAAGDPALAPLVADAGHYVQTQRTTTTGATQVLFDANALNAAISAAGRSVWSPDRPLLWVTLPPQDPVASAALRARLEAAARARGLPITISVGTLADAASSAEALRAAARRAGASAALLGQAAPNDPASLQWTFAAAAADSRLIGGPELAIDGAADALVSAARALEREPAAEFDCQISGVVDLVSFTNALSIVTAAPGVSEVAVRSVDADTLTLHLKAHGDAAALERALTGERLHPVGAGAANAGAAGLLEYRYQAGL